MRKPHTVRCAETARSSGKRFRQRAFPELRLKHDRARHIWGQRSADGGMGAMTAVVIPWLVDRLDGGLTWQAIAWWIHNHLAYRESFHFFPSC